MGKIDLLVQVSGVKNKPRAYRSRSTQNVAALAKSVEETPDLSIPRCSWEMGIPQMPLHRLLHKNLALKAYKDYLTQELKRSKHQQRSAFVD